MYKYLSVSLMMVSGWVFSQQHYCGFDHAQERLEAMDPQSKLRREQLEMKINNEGVEATIERHLSALRKTTGKQVNGVYEIPVVVHIIESSAEKNASFKVTDEQIKEWIDTTNKTYATTAGHGIAPEGSGNEDGTVMPFKLVLAQRSPNCTATTGIVRYDASSLEGYDDYGLRSSVNGITESQMLGVAPHWSESAYYNIYIVTTFDGDRTSYGLMGYAYFPSSSDSYFHTVMKVAVVKNPYDTTLAHEFGHSMGLHHPFGDADSNGGVCPSNDDCTKDNDMVCDTEPTQSLISTTVKSGDINPCTNLPYEGVQYNIMNYTYTPSKFTPGQRDRALAVFLEARGSLLQSLAAEPLPTSVEYIQTAASCNPTINSANEGNPYGMGPLSVKLNTIANQTGSYGTGNEYIDYSKNNCLTDAMKTTLDLAKAPYTLEVKVGTNPQYIKAWIDYNNDGVFDSSEVIAKTTGKHPIESAFTASVNIPSSAILNTPLRMRVIADWNSIADTGCGELDYGQAEDYMVTILDSTLATDETSTKVKTGVIYDENDNTLKLNQGAFGQYSIYDASGRLVQKGNEATANIRLQFRDKGMYIVRFEQNKNPISHKFLLK